MAYRRTSLSSVLVFASIAAAVACETGEPPPFGGFDGGPVFPVTDASFGTFDAVVGEQRRACANPAWACWPMPNPASVGLPNPARYDKSVSLVVNDDVTQLTWQRDVPPPTFTWQAAKEQCANLTLAGSGDWRLPTRIELVSLVDFSRASPAIDTDAFIGVAANVWTATPALGTGGPPARAWQVSFSGGGATTIASETFEGRVRCVRARFPVGEPTSRYRIAGAAPGEIVTDLGTGLVWQRDAGDATFSFEEARAHCAALLLEGQGWRVPSVKELQTLVYDARSQAPFIDTEAFPDTPAGRAPYWTSSSSATVAGAAWFVNFGTGESGDVALAAGDVEDQPSFVRCVR